MEYGVVVLLAEGILGWTGGGVPPRSEVGRLHAVDFVIKGSPITGSEIVFRRIERACIDGEVVACAKDGTFGGKCDIVEGSNVGDEVIRSIISELRM